MNLSEPKEEALIPKPLPGGPDWWITIALLAVTFGAMVIHSGYALKAHGTTWGAIVSFLRVMWAEEIPVAA